MPESELSAYLSDKLQELLDKAEGPDGLPDERKEMEELKALLPEIQEKVEDATEGLKTASTAVKDVLVSWGRGLFSCHDFMINRPVRFFFFFLYINKM